MNTEKLTEAMGNPDKNSVTGIIGCYIIWQLQNMSNTELAETVSEEIEKGILSAVGALEEVTKEAKKKAVKGSAAMSDAEVFGIVRKYIGIADAVSPEETAGFDPYASDGSLHARAEVRETAKNTAFAVDMSIFD